MKQSEEILDKKTESAVIDANENLESGRAFYVQGDGNGAAACFERAIAIKPDCEEAYLWLGLVMHASGNFKNAIEYFEHATEIKPNYFEAWFFLGNANLAIGKIDKAIEYLKRTIDIKPNYFEAYFFLGNANLTLGKLENAINYFKHAIEINPDFRESYIGIKRALDSMGLPDLEIDSYGKILKYINDAGPQLIRIETSSICNLRCQHCPTGTSYKDTERGTMGMDIFELILVQIKKMKILYSCVLYLGGEPLLNKDFPVMCQRIKNETEIVHSQFNTNAMLITEEICRHLANAKVDRVGISVDGRSTEENDVIRLGSKYQTIVKNVLMLQKYMKETLIEIDNTIIKRVGDPENPIIPEFLSRDFPGIPVSTNYAMKWPGLDLNKSSIKQLSIEKKQPYYFCSRPFREISIRSNGEVTMCCYDILGENVMGNILNESLMDIWSGEQYKVLRINMLNREIDLLPAVCRKCIIYTGEIPLLLNDISKDSK